MTETRLWLLSIGSTVVILVLLALHFAVMHFSPAFLGVSVEEVRSFGEMVSRGRSGAQMVLYVLFLAVALYHGLYGLRGVVLELEFAQRWRRPITWLLALVGLLFFVYGTYVTWWTFAVA
jgi:succinate dehydrogenase / fumarate reductase membrane anchor subunit